MVNHLDFPATLVDCICCLARGQKMPRKAVAAAPPNWYSATSLKNKDPAIGGSDVSHSSQANASEIGADFAVIAFLFNSIYPVPPI